MCFAIEILWHRIQALHSLTENPKYTPLELVLFQEGIAAGIQLCAARELDYVFHRSSRSGPRSPSTTSKQAASPMKAEAFAVVRRSAIATANRSALRCRRLAVRAVLHSKLGASEDVVENRVRKAPHFKWNECELQRICVAKLESYEGVGPGQKQRHDPIA